MKKILTILFLCFTLPAMAATSDWLGETSKYLPSNYLTAEKAWCMQIEANIESPCTTVRDFQTQQQPEKNQYSRYGSVKDAKFENNIPTIQGSPEKTEFLRGLGYVDVYFKPNNGNEQRVAQTREASGGAFGVWRRESTPGTVIFRKEGYKEKRVNIDEWPSDGIIWLEKENSTPQKSANTPTTQSTNTQTRQVTERSTTTRNSTTQTNSKSQQITVRVEKKADGSPVSGVNVYIFENPNDFVNDKSQLDRYLFGKTKPDGTLSFYVKQLGGLVAIDNNSITEGELVKQYIKQDGTILFKIDSPAPSLTGTPNKTVTTTSSSQSQVGVSNSNVVHASKTRTTELQTPIKVQVLYSDKIPVQNVSVFYTPNTNDRTFLNNPSNSKYNINGNAQTDSDGKVTIYTKSRTGLIATKFGNNDFIVSVEPEDWRTTRIMLTRNSPNTSNRKGGDGDSSQQSAECTPEEKDHSGPNATLDSNGKCVSVSASDTIRISGTVMYSDKSPASGVYLMPYNVKPTNLNSARSGSDGAFTIDKFPKNTPLIARFLTENDAFIDYNTIKNAPTNIDVVIKSEIDESVINGDCMNSTNKKKLHAAAGKWLESDNACVPDECESERYELLNQGTLNATCEDQVGKDCAPENDNLAITGKYAWKNNELICETDTCFEGYTIKDGFCEPTDPMKNRTNENCTKRELQAQDKNATAGTVLVWTEQKVTCTITGCTDGWDTDLSNSKCIQSTCKCGNQWNKALKKCEPLTDKNCTNTVVGATIAEWDCDENGNSYCKIIACDTTNGYELANNKCECTALGFEKNKDGTCTPKMVLTREQYQDEIKELSENAQKMLDNENSLINKTIGAAGIGAVGIGGSMVGAAISERAADDDAERAMRAYLNTFKCEYGDGKQINGGEVNVELPGGNDMFELYTEYATLANDLKVRKEALGLRPGIESEVSIDKSETGLYDDVGTGITGGAYASIARALQNPDGEDAKMWAAMRAATDSKLKTGAIVAGAGAAASLAANIAVNHNVKNNVDEIKQRYAAMKHPFENAQRRADSNPIQRKCSDYQGADGQYPNCTCHNNTTKWWFNTEEGCHECLGDLVVNEETKSSCTCPNGKVQEGTTCKAPTPDCPLTKLKQANTCKCVDNAEVKTGDTDCSCGNGYEETNEGTCAKVPEGGGNDEHIDDEHVEEIIAGKEIAAVTFNSDDYFLSGKDQLTEKGITDLNTFIQESQTAAENASLDLAQSNDYCLIIVGKTDHQGFKTPNNKLNNNQSLSERRAMTVKNFITKNSYIPSGNMIAFGIADKDCPAKPIKNDTCRVVKATLIAGSCDTNTKGTDKWISNVIDNKKIISTVTSAVQSINK